MKLFNTLTRTLEEFTPLNPGSITIYSCGPTVYQRAHIGNLSSYIYVDTLRRALSLAFPDAKITHVVNITDVDDKTIKQAKEKYPELPHKEGLKKLTEEHTSQFMSDLEAIGVDVQAMTFVRATDHIADMQKLIQKLLKSGMAYIASDGIYFSINKYTTAGKTYGQLSKIDTASTSEARIANDEYDKTDAHDFSLWKFQKDDEPAWEFFVDGKNLVGRPGWHIECSAMSTRYLGQPFDIHTGGVDLIFPHHENEIAQSTATGKADKLANFFIHNEHMLVDGKKMAKSAGNFYTLDDLKTKGFEPLVLRLVVLQSHYQSQLDFSFETMTATQNRLANLRALAGYRWQYKQDTDVDTAKLTDNIFNNLHTPGVLEHINFTPSQAEATVQLLDKLLGLSLASTEDAPKEVKDIIAKRQLARSKKDFELADKLRNDAQKLGFKLSDQDEEIYWERTIS